MTLQLPTAHYHRHHSLGNIPWWKSIISSQINISSLMQLIDSCPKLPIITSDASPAFRKPLAVVIAIDGSFRNDSSHPHLLDGCCWWCFFHTVPQGTIFTTTTSVVVVAADKAGLWCARSGYTAPGGGRMWKKLIVWTQPNVSPDNKGNMNEEIHPIQCTIPRSPSPPAD